MKDMIQVLNLLRKLGYSKDEIRFRPTSRITAVRVAGEIAYNGFGLGAVERKPVRWENCAKPVLAVRAGLLTIKLK